VPLAPQKCSRPSRILGKRSTFIIAAARGVAGILVTYFSVPNLKADDLTAEDGRYHAHLVADRWDGELREQDSKAFADKRVRLRRWRKGMERWRDTEKRI